MVLYCIVKGCKTTHYRCIEENEENEIYIPLFRFPSNALLKEKWIEALKTLNNQENYAKAGKICALHFSDECIETRGSAQYRLRPNSIPSIFPRNGQHSTRVKHETNIEPSINDGIHMQPSTSTSLIPPHWEVKREIINSPQRSAQEYLSEVNSGVVERNEENENVICSTPRKLIRFPGDASNSKAENMTPKTLNQYVNVLKKSCANKDKTIKRLNAQSRRQKRRIVSLENLLQELREQCQLSSNSSHVIEAITEESVIKEIQAGKVNGQYPPGLRAFALTVNFYSPKAYNYIRQVFHNKLPSPSTIRAWYSSTDGSPGFTKEAVEILKRKSEEAGDKKIYACLTMDEMAIRSQVVWDKSKAKFVGYIDTGIHAENNENLPLAKEALVYLLTGVNQRWKIPVAYFFITGLTAEEKSAITTKVLEFVSAANIHIIALTFDGLAANLNMCRRLGADVLEKESILRQPNGCNVYVFLDAAHMLKLIRNVFASKRILYNYEGEIINFDYIEKLVQLQEAGCFHLGNKLNKKHIQWYKNKMSVKLAAQTLSESCSTALEVLLEDKHPAFVGCAATAHFCRVVNNVFDCLNSRSLFSYKYKRPLKSDTAEEIFNFFTYATHYLSNIKLTKDGPPITQTPLKTGFLGCIINMINLKHIFHEYIETEQLQYLLTYKLSQDHLETFFSCIRSMGGFNNNPNCVQFSAAYKRLLHRNEVKSSADGNCISLDTTNILTVPSTKKIDSRTGIFVEESDEDVISIEEFVPLNTLYEGLHHAVMYTAGFVERKILKRIKCLTCVTLIDECTAAHSNFIAHKSCGSLRYPRKDTFTICSMTEKVFNIYKVENKLQITNAKHKMIVATIRNINMFALFRNFDIHSMEEDVLQNHKYEIIKLIISFYLDIKLRYEGTVQTLNYHKTFIRKSLTKTVLFRGQ